MPFKIQPAPYSIYFNPPHVDLRPATVAFVECLHAGTGYANPKAWKESFMNENLEFESSRTGRSLFWFLTGAAAGSVAVFMFDPVRGSRRRALALDKVKSIRYESLLYGGKVLRRLKNRVFGMATEFTSQWSARPVIDEVLNERIRSAFGHVITHAKSIESKVEDGVVCLQGAVLASEVNDLIKCVKRVKGVVKVINQLEVHQSHENIPGLQGEDKPYVQ